MDKSWLTASRRIEGFFSVYAIFAAIVCISDGAGRTPGLSVGYWFGWNPIVLVIYLIPYVTTYLPKQGVIATDETLPGNDYVVLVAHKSIWIRYHLQLVCSFAITGVYLAFFVLRMVDLANHCGTGTECDAQTTAYVLYSVCALLMALCGLGVFLVLVTCPMASPHVSLSRMAITTSTATADHTSEVPAQSLAHPSSAHSRNAVLRQPLAQAVQQ